VIGMGDTSAGLSEPGASAPPRRRVRRRWIALAGIVTVGVVAAAAVWGIAGYLAYDQLSTVHSGCASREFRTQTPADFTAYDGDHSLEVDTTPYRFTDYTDVAFPSRDPSLTIRGWYAPGPGGIAAPTVIVVHGRDSCRRDPVVMLPAAMLHRAGFGVLMIDLRNHGDSDSDNGRWAGGAKEYRDVLGAWDWLVAQGADPARVGLYGPSLGAGTVTIAMGEEPRVAATFADSSYYSFDVASSEYTESQGYPAWVVPAGILVGRLLGETELGTRDPASEIVRLAGRPFDIVHGLSDTTVLPHNAVELAAAAYAAGTSVEPWIIPGAEHTQGMLLRPDDYEARLVAYFRGALGDPKAVAFRA
jgi:dipeptidyl aminopeptidase/acylaminoacyl peptidase